MKESISHVAGRLHEAILTLAGTEADQRTRLQSAYIHYIFGLHEDTLDNEEFREHISAIRDDFENYGGLKLDKSIPQEVVNRLIDEIVLAYGIAKALSS